MSQYWKLRFRSTHPDEDLALLLARGAAGGVISDEEIDCYFEGTEDEAISFIVSNSNETIFLIDRTVLPLENWVAASSAVWHETVAGELTVTPLEEEFAPAEQDRERIFIVPGMGFGTGQHDSTRLALQLLQHPELRKHPPIRALDVGTGSGVLAIGFSKLYESKIVAFDNDPLAVENARKNFRINAMPEGCLFVGELPSVASRRLFDLIVANIYAEVLCDIEAGLAERLKQGGLAVLSGIRNDKSELVAETYRAGGWSLVCEERTAEWTAMLYRTASKTP